MEKNEFFDMLYHIFGGLSEEDLDKAKQNLVDSGYIKVIETEFGTIEIIQSSILNDNEIIYKDG